MTDTKPPDWRHAAAMLSLSALTWHAQADSALISDQGLGDLNDDYCANIARKFRELAQVDEHYSDLARERQFAESCTADGAA